MADTTTGSVTLDFKDANRRSIKDSVRLTLGQEADAALPWTLKS
jgi:hypothetical protein